MPFVQDPPQPRLDTTMDFANIATRSFSFRTPAGVRRLVFVVDPPPPFLAHLMPSREAMQADAEDYARVLFGEDHGFQVSFEIEGA